MQTYILKIFLYKGFIFQVESLMFISNEKTLKRLILTLNKQLIDFLIKKP